MLWSKKQTGNAVKAHWEALYAANAQDFNKILDERLSWSQWERNSSPDSAAEVELSTGIKILLGSDDTALARRYLELSVEMADRIDSEDRLRTSIEFPRNRGRVSRTRAYAQTLLGQPWTTHLLLSASKDYEEHCRRNYENLEDWHSQVQYYYLNAVHLALLGDDVKRADQLLDSPPYPLNYQKEHAGVLKGLVRFIRGELSGQEVAKFVAEFESYFDRLRDPRIKQPGNSFRESFMCPVELGLLREKYIRHPGGATSWHRVIEDYAR